MSFTQALPQSLSPSRLSDFQTCPRRYQYASIERIPQPASYATAKGRFAHFVFEQLFKLAPAERTIDNAREFIAPAVEEILTEDVRADIAMDDAMLAKLIAETDSIITTYFLMEDPTQVSSEGVELRLGATVNGAPLFGILDRLDRDDDGTLAIVLCDLDLPVAAIPTGAMPASHHHHMPMAADHAAHQHAAHGDSTCPYAQSAGPAPLPTLPVLATGTTFDHPPLPAAVTQTLLSFGPIRQPSSRGPPHLA